jgi:hypothetical protein
VAHTNSCPLANFGTIFLGITRLGVKLTMRLFLCIVSKWMESCSRFPGTLYIVQGSEFTVHRKIIQNRQFRGWGVRDVYSSMFYINLFDYLLWDWCGNYYKFISQSGCANYICSLFNIFGFVHLCEVQWYNKLMQLLIVFISYLIIYSTCFERHPLIIRSFLYCTYSCLSVALSCCKQDSAVDRQQHR